MHERLFVSAGVRGDRSSNNGDVDKYFFYPKAAASYRLPGGAGPFGDVKFRLAWGQSGNQPLYGMKFLAVDATQNIGGIPGLVAPGTVGDPTIKPEPQTEIEGGVDATLASGRASVERGGSPPAIWGTGPDDSLKGSHAERIGDANPDFVWSFGSELTVRRFTLNALAEWQHGGNILTLPKLIWAFGGTTTDCPTTCAQRLAVFGKDTRQFVESATYFKLREGTLSYDLPVRAYE